MRLLIWRVMRCGMALCVVIPARCADLKEIPPSDLQQKIMTYEQSAFQLDLAGMLKPIRFEKTNAKQIWTQTVTPAITPETAKRFGLSELLNEFFAFGTKRARVCELANQIKTILMTHGAQEKLFEKLKWDARNNFARVINQYPHRAKEDLHKAFRSKMRHPQKWAVHYILLKHPEALNNKGYWVNVQAAEGEGIERNALINFSHLVFQLALPALFSAYHDQWKKGQPETLAWSAAENAFDRAVENIHREWNEYYYAHLLRRLRVFSDTEDLSNVIPAEMDHATPLLEMIEEQMHHRFIEGHRDSFMHFANNDYSTEVQTILTLGGHAIKWATTEYIMTVVPRPPMYVIDHFIRAANQRVFRESIWHEWSALKLEGIPNQLRAFIQPHFAKHLTQFIAGLLGLEYALTTLVFFVTPSFRRLRKQIEQKTNPIFISTTCSDLPEGYADFLLRVAPSYGSITNWYLYSTVKRLWIMDGAGHVKGDAERGDAWIGLFIRITMTYFNLTEHEFTYQVLSSDYIFELLMRSLFRKNNIVIRDMSKKGISQLFEATASVINAAPNLIQPHNFFRTGQWVLKQYLNFSAENAPLPPQIRLLVDEWLTFWNSRAAASTPSSLLLRPT